MCGILQLSDILLPGAQRTTTSSVFQYDKFTATS